MNRTDILHFKTSLPERAAAEALAQFEQVKLSEALRLALREAAARRGLWPAANLEQHPTPDILPGLGDISNFGIQKG